MSFVCKICLKAPRAGNSVSKSKRATKRRFLPNIQKVRISLNGTTKRVYVCTSCIRSGNISKVA